MILEKNCFAQDASIEMISPSYLHIIPVLLCILVERIRKICATRIETTLKGSTDKDWAKQDWP